MRSFQRSSRVSLRGVAEGDTLRRWISSARLEVLPTASAHDLVLAHSPRSRGVTVTASPSKGLEATLALTERLADHGYPVVPHLAARMIRGRSELAEIVERLTAHGVTRVFVPAGDAEVAECYVDALALLEDLAELAHPFSHIGITGYPESHPTIHDDVTVQSMWDKRRYATHIVSNLTFSPTAVESWITRLRTRGVGLPVLLGLPGPVHRAKLLAMATKIGVGESTRFLLKNKSLFGRLAAPGGGFTGERFLTACAAAVGGPRAGVEGIHIYTFNQIAEAEAWLLDLLHRFAP